MSVIEFFAVYYVFAVSKMRMLLTRYMLEGFHIIQLRMTFEVTLIVAAP